MIFFKQPSAWPGFFLHRRWTCKPLIEGGCALGIHLWYRGAWRFARGEVPHYAARNSAVTSRYMHASSWSNRAETRPTWEISLQICKKDAELDFCHRVHQTWALFRERLAYCHQLTALAPSTVSLPKQSADTTDSSSFSNMIARSTPSGGAVRTYSGAC